MDGALLRLEGAGDAEERGRVLAQRWQSAAQRRATRAAGLLKQAAMRSAVTSTYVADAAG